MQRTWTSICSLLLASLVTEAPQANFLPNFLDASASLIPNKSRPVTVVTHLRLLRVARSINTCVEGRSQSADNNGAARSSRARASFLADFLLLFFFSGSASGCSAAPGCDSPAACARGERGH